LANPISRFTHKIIAGDRTSTVVLLTSVIIILIITAILLRIFGWTISQTKDLATIIQSIVTPVGLMIGGVWAYRRYVLEESNYPHLQTSAEINFVGLQGDYWIVELVAIIENKGKVPQRIKTFEFDLNALFHDETATIGKNWEGQVNFGHKLAAASFIPESFRYFVVGPNVTSRYSHVTRVTKDASFLILHCRFDYWDARRFSHAMEKTSKVPSAEIK
jgi:hypothetical protein